MYARVNSGQVHPDKVEEVTRIYQESIIPVTQQAPGFKGMLFLGDRTTGKGVTITLWETEADMQASSGMRQEQAAKLASFLVGVPSVETYEVFARV